ncbi:MAG TPA: DUF1330 domain-containing protein [Myxococcota bacterium]|nr:DUF1330 domain-containing protein [Myxococcota bacterium]
MAAYLFIKTRITDPERYQQYVEAARALGGEQGARYVARGRPLDVLEGSADEWGDFFLMVTKFPSLEAARAFWRSPAYQAARRLREGAGEVHVVLAEELPAAPADSVRTARVALGD